MMAVGVVFLRTVKASGEKGTEHDRSTVSEGLIGRPLWKGEV